MWDTAPWPNVERTRSGGGEAGGGSRVPRWPIDLVPWGHRPPL